MTERRKYWHGKDGERRESDQIDAFLADLFALYEKHGFALAHEDGHGSFLIVEDSDEMRAWMMAVSDYR